MSGIISTFKSRRIAARNNRAFQRVIDHSASPTMRDEIILMSQRTANAINR